MASGGSSGRATASGSRSFDFGSDDVLFSYDDSLAQDPSNGKRSDPPGKDLHDNRMGKSLIRVYEQEDYSMEGVLSSVEKCMKKYVDNLHRSLEGVSGRLTQLELVCYKLERTVGELRADFMQDQGEKDMKFKSFEKHLQEVHRSVQILRHKQELAETQKELAKLQLAQKDSADAIIQAVSEPNSIKEKPDSANQQLVLAVPRQIAPTVIPAGTSQQVLPYKELPLPQQAPVPPNIQQDHTIMNQVGNYYLQQPTLPRDQHSQSARPELHYIHSRPQLQDRPIQAMPQQQLSVNRNQHQLPPQHNQQLLQQPASQAQIRSQPPPVYAPYQSPSPVASGPETFLSRMPMQGPNPTITQAVGIRPEASPYHYGGTNMSVLPPPMQNNTQPPVSQGSFPPQPGSGGYMSTALPPPYSMQGYNAAYSYPSSNLPAARNQQMPPLPHHYDSQPIRNHPYREMIEKAVSMGFDRNQVTNVVQRMGESGQPVDFNSLLNILNGHAGGPSTSAW
ncbi:uncharacterized protein LOC141825526 [Curcuma longa]|uniref:uncharacterized protein LOC141825526 n=1 Tax=Curcuma longa TaxID=136217 RepID=UPI003D9F3BEC